MRAAWLFLLLLALPSGAAQTSRVEGRFPSYVALFLDADGVVFDFEADSAPSAGLLSQLDPAAYPDHAMPPASRQGLLTCLGEPAPHGNYRASDRPEAIAWVCRFAPTRIERSDAFEVSYRDAGSAACREGLSADASLLILANTRWRVWARVTRPPPPGTKLHLVPLTYKNPRTLCRRRPVPGGRVDRHDLELDAELALLSRDPSRRSSYAFYTPFAGVAVVPLLFYLELDLAQLDPGLAGERRVIEVEYVVMGR